MLVAMKASMLKEMYHTVADSKKSLTESVRRRVKIRNRTIVNSFNASTLNVIAEDIATSWLASFLFNTFQLTEEKISNVFDVIA